MSFFSELFVHVHVMKEIKALLTYQWDTCCRIFDSFSVPTLCFDCRSFHKKQHVDRRMQMLYCPHNLKKYTRQFQRVNNEIGNGLMFGKKSACSSSYSVNDNLNLTISFRILRYRTYFAKQKFLISSIRELSKFSISQLAVKKL